MRIRVVDHLSPEDVAMLQALYSRSADSVELHLQKVEQTGSGKFMESFYVGYNHKSIADCGSTTLFFEDVSLLAAKAIQDWPLYSGQETSTRYIDMSKQRIEDPVDSAASRRILDRWMTFYTENQERVSECVLRRHPPTLDDNRDDKARANYARALKARTFDILRGFLPAGITTQLSWHTNLRQAGDHVGWLEHHPLKEIRALAMSARIALSERYPSSGFALQSAAVTGVAEKDAEKRAAAEEARRNWYETTAWVAAYPGDSGSVAASLGFFRSTVDPELTFRYRDTLASRPRGCVLPHFMADSGQINAGFLLDFGSFRDIQRHRNGVCRMPTLTPHFGFERWYLDQLDKELSERAEELISDQMHAINALTSDSMARQYYLPLGCLVPCQVTYALPAFVYVVETRSAKTVHPTLRRVVQERMIEPFVKQFPGVRLYVDTDQDDWTVRRGRQTIEAR